MDRNEVYSDKWGRDLAGLFKQSQKQSDDIGCVVGKVTKTSPLNISILDGNVIISPESHILFISEFMLKDYKREYKSEGDIQIEGGAYRDFKAEYESITDSDSLKVGDFVLLVPSSNEQVFVIVSKIKKVGG